MVKYTIMHKDIPQMEVIVDKTNLTCNSLVDRFDVTVPMYVRPSNINLQNFNEFVESRVPSRYRADLPKILDVFGLDAWNPYFMLHETHGVSMNDFLWVKINDEDVKFDDIKIRQ